MDVTRAMQRLAAQDLLQSTGEERAHCELRMDLVRLFSVQFKSLAHTVQGNGPGNHLIMPPLPAGSDRCGVS